VISDIETESLAAHASICEQRYLNLDNRMTGLEKKVERIEKSLGDIHQKIDLLGEKQDKQIKSSLIYIIGLLLTVCGGLISKIFF
jgi:predicted  nucleic acid-binding Zn-ribbon protein